MSSRAIYVLSLTVVGIYALFALLTGTDAVRGFHAWPILVSGVLILTRVVTRLRTDAQKDIRKDHRLGMVALIAILALIGWGAYLLLK